MILALDPGLATCGWAIVAPGTGRVADLGTLLSEPTPGLDESTDRARRVWVQAQALRAIATRHGVTTIAAEAMSFGGSPKARFAMAISLGLSWGGIAALALGLGVELFEVAPKAWQHAIDPSCGKKIDYDVVFAKLSAFVRGHAAEQLVAIKKRHRNHALDAVAIGLYVALRHDAPRIAKGARA